MFKSPAKVGFGDNADDIQSLSLQVPLISFIGADGGYLAWLGNVTRNPYMNFNSNSITKKKDHWDDNGQLEFRRTFKPITINIEREDTDKEIVLNGAFQISTSDYFMGPTSSDLVASWTPFQFTMVFDKPETFFKGETLSSN